MALSPVLQNPALRYKTNFVMAMLTIFPAVANFSRIYIARMYSNLVETYYFETNAPWGNLFNVDKCSNSLRLCPTQTEHRVQKSSCPQLKNSTTDTYPGRECFCIHRANASTIFMSKHTSSSSSSLAVSRPSIAESSDLAEHKNQEQSEKILDRILFYII